MKKIILHLIFLVVLQQIGFAQYLKIVATDIDYVSDTVVIQYNNNATIGLDPSKGEVDLTNIPITTEKYLRIRQRDSAHFSCLYQLYQDSVGYQPIYFPVSFDSRINKRKPIANNLANRSFEINCGDRDVYYILMYSNQNIKDIIERIDVITECSPVTRDQLWAAAGTYCGATSLTTKISGLHITFKNSIFTATDDVINTENELNLTSNVVSHEIVVKSEKSDGVLYVLNSLGQQVLPLETFERETPKSINVQQLPQGIYFVAAKSADGRQLKPSKFIKME